MTIIGRGLGKPHDDATKTMDKPQCVVSSIPVTPYLHQQQKRRRNDFDLLEKATMSMYGLSQEDVSGISRDMDMMLTSSLDFTFAHVSRFRTGASMSTIMSADAIGANEVSSYELVGYNLRRHSTVSKSKDKEPLKTPIIGMRFGSGPHASKSVAFDYSNFACGMRGGFYRHGITVDISSRFSSGVSLVPVSKLSITDMEYSMWDVSPSGSIHELSPSLRNDAYYLTNYVVERVYLMSLSMPFFGSTMGLEIVTPYTSPVYDEITGTRLYDQEYEDVALQTIAHKVSVPMFVMFFRKLMERCTTS